MLVISIPVLLLWNVRIPPRKKAVLLGIFSLTVFVMVAAITRVTMVDPNGLPPEASWIFFWSNIELTICKYLFWLVTRAF